MKFTRGEGTLFVRFSSRDECPSGGPQRTDMTKVTRVRRAWVVLGIAFVASFVPRLARGDSLTFERDAFVDYDIGSPGWKLRLEATTDVLVAAGGRVSVQTPSRFRASTSFGFLPRAYLSAMNAVAMGAGAYDAETGALVSDAFRSAFAWRLQGGLNPVEDSGFYIEFGYMLYAVRAHVAGDQVVDESTLTAASELGVDLTTLVHCTTFEAGWEWTFAEHFSFRASLGVAFALGSRTSFSGELVDAAQGSTELAAARFRLDDAIASNGVAPLVTLGAGYVF